jgi:hypothetical protein
MTKPWHEARPDLVSEIQEVLRTDYPDLYFLLEGQTAKICGSFPIADDAGAIDRFAIAVTFPDTFPDDLPAVRETGGRIPHIADRHVNTNGTACLLVPEEWFVISPDRSFRAFMAGPVRNYFLGQALVELGKPWPFGERQHGLPGLIDTYAELLGVTDTVLVEYLFYLEKLTVKGHWQCPCGSGAVLRRCHLTKVRELQKRIPPHIAAKMLGRLRTQVKLEKAVTGT